MRNLIELNVVIKNIEGVTVTIKPNWSPTIDSLTL